MPGTSRHHWGTDFDINSVEEAYFEEEQGQREYAWLCAHAGTFGFFQPYTAKGKGRQHGYEEEKWHWSFGAESERFLEQYNQEIGYADLTGFAGCEVAEAIQVIAVYVNGIARGEV
jgi:D-alanyl-D-alanine carboxypeptidase